MAIDYRKIPTRKIIEGDFSVGVKYVGRAMEILHNLERNMQFQKLKQLSDFWRDDKVIIEAWHGFGQSQVKITVTGGGAVVPRKQRIKCFCLPCFAHGYITDVTYIDPCSYYSVEICQYTKKSATQFGVYVEVTGVLALDYAVYELGQPVLVSIVPCATGAICGCSTGLTMCEIAAIPPASLPCSLCIVPLHIEDDYTGGYIKVPKWKQVDPI